MVNVRYNKVNYHVGYFTDLSDAIIARNDAMFKLFGSGGLQRAFSLDKRNVKLQGREKDQVPSSKRKTKFDILLGKMTSSPEDRKLQQIAEDLKRKIKKVEDINL